ncbi:MAG: hypothetical protein JWL90_3833 [Chthoniobacteraceae bacterium]|nr:hypothetical protein [Chthoniobacteraceae bacterium]
MNAQIALFLSTLFAAAPLMAQDDRGADPDALPEVAAGFEIRLWAKEPLVRNPCSLAFDARGRMYVGMGPQYRNPTPQTPPDSVYILTGTDGGADTKKVFATGFNCIQSLAWHGRDLWVANSPDLTIVRDLDGDDVADEYVRVFTDLGNIEHALHGLNWVPDGRLYMSKGNSKGLMLPGRIAPKPFRDLAGMTAPAGTPDLPPPQTFSAADYRATFQDPRDDWGREGGILRCEEGGANLEIVARGLRNPWDIAFNATFDWLGTDNDQNEGDRFFMPFAGAHFGWGHSWSANWTGAGHLPTTPISGPVFPGSGTGIVWADLPSWPASHRGVFLVNDWLLKNTGVYQPRWTGALMEPAADPFSNPLVRGGNSLFRPTDLEFGPDGALYILGWGRPYGLVAKNGEQQNEGRIYRIAPTGAAPVKDSPGRGKPLSAWTFAELNEDLAHWLPVRRIDASDELVRRGAQSELRDLLSHPNLSTAQRTWTMWTLGRIAPGETALDDWFSHLPGNDPNALRILGDRARRSKHEPHPAIYAALKNNDARLRLAAVLALREARSPKALPALIELAANESDRLTFYAAWGALRELAPAEELRPLLSDARGGVRRAALLAMLDAHSLKAGEAAPFTKDADAATAQVASLFLGKSGAEPIPATAPPDAFPLRITPTDLRSRSGAPVRVVAGGMRAGAAVYTDRPYKLVRVPEMLAGSTFIRTSNNDAGSSGDNALTFDLPAPATVFIAHDRRMAARPKWMRIGEPDGFSDSDLELATNDGMFHIWQKNFAAGHVTLGGNTEDGVSSGKSSYIIAIKAAPLVPPPAPATLADVLEALKTADAKRGEWLFAGENGANCWRCHRERGFGPNLAGIGGRGDAPSLIQSILEPNAVITEGFALLSIETKDGRTHTGTLAEETDITLTLSQVDGPADRIDKSAIGKRESLHASPMPPFGSILSAGQVADLTAYLLTLKTAAPLPAVNPVAPGFAFEQRDDRLVILHDGKPVAHYVFRDPAVTRPFFAHLHEPGGAQVTRDFPPSAGSDHPTMHPGVWLAWGDINGLDFWRNAVPIRHQRFIQAPEIKNGRLTFATESSLGQETGLLLSRFTIREAARGWLIEWDATIAAGAKELVFGDQEEMCFAARLAMPLIEKNGGVLLTDNGARTAAATWGKPFAWTDGSALIDGKRVGLAIFAHPGNPRPSRWHNRDYGLIGANLFALKAFNAGAPEPIVIKPGASLRLRYAVFTHGEADVAAGFKAFME